MSKYKDDISIKKNNVKENEIKIIVNIRESDINKNIYFLDNIDDPKEKIKEEEDDEEEEEEEDDEEEEEECQNNKQLFKDKSDKLKEMNELNTFLYT